MLGVLAIRLQSLNKTLLWDGEKMQFNNISANDELKIVTSMILTSLMAIQRLTSNMKNSMPLKVQTDILNIIIVKVGIYQLCQCNSQAGKYYYP